MSALVPIQQEIPRTITPEIIVQDQFVRTQPHSPLLHELTNSRRPCCLVYVLASACFLEISRSRIPSCFRSPRNKRAFRTSPSGSLTSRTQLSRCTTSRSLLLLSSLRTREISECWKTRAAEMGTVLRKKDRSRDRMARLTGGRNMAGNSRLRPSSGCSIDDSRRALLGVEMGD